MIKSKELEEKIKKSGLKKGYIAKKLSLSSAGFRLKLNGQNYFNTYEIIKLSELLNISPEEREYIFFTS